MIFRYGTNLHVRTVYCPFKDGI